MVIKQGESRNITFNFNIEADALQRHEAGLSTVNWFMYCGEEFYFRVVVVIKNPVFNVSEQAFRKSVKCLLLNLASLLLLAGIIVSMKKESDARERLYSGRN